MNLAIVNLRNCKACRKIFEPEVLGDSEEYCVECDPRLQLPEHHEIDREE